jgi:hypothetical protein
MQFVDITTLSSSIFSLEVCANRGEAAKELQAENIRPNSVPELHYHPVAFQQQSVKLRSIRKGKISTLMQHWSV